MMRHPIRWLLLVTLLLTGFWFYRAPRRAWDRFNRALLTGQEAELTATIDFPQVRDHLKEDLRTAIGHSSSGASLPAAVIGALAEQVVSLVVTPQGLSQLVTEFGTRRPSADTNGGIATASEVDFRYRGVSRVDVALRSGTDAEPADGLFTFTRSGLSWRLTRVWSDRLNPTGASP